MSHASIAMGIRENLIQSGLVTDVYLDSAPAQTAIPPYMTYNYNSGTQSALKGDSEAFYLTREVQLDLWVLPSHEDPVVIRDIRNLLDSMRIELDIGRVLKMQVAAVNRIPEGPGENLAHHSFTLQMVHDRAAV